MANTHMASAPPKKRNRRHNVPRSTYVPGNPGGSTFSYVEEENGNVEHHEYEYDHHIDLKLKEYEGPSSEMTQTQLDNCCPYIYYLKTPASKGHRFINDLKWSYSRHVLNKPENKTDIPADKADYHKYIRIDPLGTREPGFDDARCWTYPKLNTSCVGF